MGIDIAPPMLFVGVKMEPSELFVETKVWAGCEHGAPEKARYCPTCGKERKWELAWLPREELPFQANRGHGFALCDGGYIGELEYLPRVDFSGIMPRLILVGLELKNEEPHGDLSTRIDDSPSAASFKVVTTAAERVCRLLESYGLGAKVGKVKIWAYIDIG